MGTALVRRAIVVRSVYPHVSNASYLVLLRMCLSAYDNDEGPDKPARHYFAGWKPLGLVLGYKDPGDDHDLDPTAKQAVARSLRELTAYGLVRRGATRYTGGTRTRIYEIRV